MEYGIWSHTIYMQIMQRKIPVAAKQLLDLQILKNSGNRSTRQQEDTASGEEGKDRMVSQISLITDT